VEASGGGGGEKRKEGADYEEEGVELHLDGVVASCWRYGRLGLMVCCKSDGDELEREPGAVLIGIRWVRVIRMCEHTVSITAYTNKQRGVELQSSSEANSCIGLHTVSLSLSPK